MSDVFISYSRLDRDFVGKLREALTEQQQDVWIDWESIPPSQTWWGEIQKGIARANNFVVVLSPNSMASPICQMEIEAARRLGKRIIPVLHLDYSRDDAIKAMAIRLATSDQDAVRQLWGTHQPHTLFDANDSVLKHINYFFFRPEDDFAARFSALLTVIRTDYEHKERHTTYELRALEWSRRQQNVSFLLLDDELVGAQEWLLQAEGKEPPPTSLQREYIQASEKRTRQLRDIRRASIIGSAVAVFAIIVAIAAAVIGIQATDSANNAVAREANAVSRADSADTQVVNANATLSPIPGTLAAANEQIVAANTAQSVAEARAEDANTQVADAAATLSPIPGTLAAADAQLSRATATLGYVQAQGTEVAAQATYFGIEQARIGTLSAGAVVIPPGTFTPELLLPTLTGVAQLHQWEPRILFDAFGVEMVEVPPGCFMMGSVASGDEQPVNEQCFDEPFYIDRYEVTQQQFVHLDGVMAENFRYAASDHPVDNINWFEARNFCLIRDARLPTEREWEYAARGPDSLLYPWGNEFIPENIVYARTDIQGTAPVVNADGSPSRPNGASWVGSVDMIGNVAEWTSTIYASYTPSPTSYLLDRLFPFPYDATDGREQDETVDEHRSRLPNKLVRVVRGGSFFGSNIVSFRGAYRSWEGPDNPSISFGFRCARSL